MLYPFGFIGGGLNQTPVAKPAKGVGGASFTANWRAGLDNTGTYYLDVFKQDGTTFVEGYENLTVTGTSYLVDEFLGGLHTYKYKVRAQLNEIQVPTLRTSWDAVVNVTWTGGSSDIKDALAAIDDNSASKIYKLVLPDGVHFEEKVIETKPYVDIYIPPTTSVGFTGGVGLLQDTFICRGLMNIFGGGTITRTCNIADGDTNYPIHVTTGDGGQVILQNITLSALGTLSKSAIGADLQSGYKLYLINCNLYSQDADGTNIHNLENQPLSAQCYFINTDVTIGNSLRKGVRYTNYGSISNTDFFYIKGGNITSFEEEDGGAGAGETKIYIDASTICPSKTFENPSSNLDNAAFSAFLVANNLSISTSSNIISATTLNAGSLPLDNIGSTYLALSLRRQLTTYTGDCLRLRRDSDDDEEDFGFSGNNLDTAAIATWLGGATGYVVRWYLQDSSGLYAAQSDPTKQLIYVADRGDGKPELAQNGTMRALTITLASNVYNTKNLAIIIAGKLDTRSFFCIGNSWSQGISFFDFFNVGGITIKGSIRFASGVVYDGTQRVLSMLFKPTNVQVYNNSTETYDNNATYPDLGVTANDRVIQIGFSDDGTWQSINSTYNEITLLNTQPDETDMLAVSTQSQYWN
jgi:hypothetical protein